MSYRQIADVMKTIGEFHDELNQEIQRNSQGNGDQRLKLLAAYVKHHSEAMAAAIRRDQEDPSFDVLGTWLQFTPEAELRSALNRLRLQAGEPVSELFTRVMEADQTLQDLYQSLSEQTSAEHVREFFNSLYRESLSFAEQLSWGMREETN